MASKLPTLGYVLLSMLAREETTGYDLAGQLKHAVSFFWRARHSQIYPELARLEANGLVRYRVVEQSGRPDKKVYELTREGREALTAWVTSPLEMMPIRDEATLRAYSLWLANPNEAIGLFRSQALKHAERLAEYECYESEMQAHWKSALSRLDAPEFSTYCTLRRGIGYERASLDWCRWVAEMLESLDPKASVSV